MSHRAQADVLADERPASSVDPERLNREERT